MQLGKPGRGRLRSRRVATRYDTGAFDGPIGIPGTSEAVKIVASSMDSGLEAFSHNPADGSFAALAVQPAACTHGLNQQFLSYYVELLLRRRHISRVKLTCLTTV
jgi:hypothetical protein